MSDFYFRMKRSQPWTLVLVTLFSPALSVRIIETNSFRQDSGTSEPEQSRRQQKLVESLGIFQTEPKYVDSSEIRLDTGTKVSSPFYPLQFPAPLQYDQSNAIRYQEIQRPGNTEASFTIAGDRDIGESGAETSSSNYISPLLSLGAEYRTPLKPLISRTRDIEIYTQGDAERPYSGESIDIEMFDLPNDAVYSDNHSEENHPGMCEV